jgi:diguanylate cyclase (GGDEF)-like protein
VTIQRRIILFFTVVTLLLLAVILMMLYRLNLQRQLTRAEQSRYRSYRLATELKNSVDEQTRMIRTYTLTGNPDYLENYYHIIRIREGKEPRPRNYDILYWDRLPLRSGYRPEPGDRAVSFLRLLQEARMSPDELKILRESKQYADQLRAIEKRAIRLMQLARAGDELSEAEILSAQEFLHGSRYHELRRKLMEELERFFRMIDQRTARKVQEISRVSMLMDWTLFGMVAILLAIALISWIHSRRSIVSPLQQLIRWTDDLKRGRFSITNTIKGRDEIAQLARSFTLMAETIHENLSELDTRANTDRLTALPNRRRLETELEHMHMAARIYGIRNHIVLADLDHFKRINDRYGHETGDAVLQAFARFLKERVREPHIVGRWGGEEFLLLFRNLGTAEVLKELEELRRGLHRYTETWNLPRVTASYGVAYLDPRLEVAQALQYADRALYRAKEKGRDWIELESGIPGKVAP